MALGVEAHDLGSRIVEGPQLALPGDVKRVHRGCLRKRPLVGGLAVLVEYLHAAVAAIAHLDAARQGVSTDAVHHAQIAGPHVRRRAFHSPAEEELAILIELRDGVPL
jgi:hypothetical protein